MLWNTFSLLIKPFPWFVVFVVVVTGCLLMDKAFVL
jgi:hypothetical protein